MECGKGSKVGECKPGNVSFYRNGNSALGIAAESRKRAGCALTALKRKARAAGNALDLEDVKLIISKIAVKGLDRSFI